VASHWMFRAEHKPAQRGHAILANTTSGSGGRRLLESSAENTQVGTLLPVDFSRQSQLLLVFPKMNTENQFVTGFAVV
jgi:hypothetical protein